jgi:hypothetical protein
MEAWFCSQEEQAEVNSFRYFLKITSLSPSSPQPELDFLGQVYTFCYHIKDNTHDKDGTTDQVGKTLESLFVVVNNTGVPHIYKPGPFKNKIDKDPAYVVERLRDTGIKITKLLAFNQPVDRINNLGQLLDETEIFVEMVLRLGSFQSFQDFMKIYPEVKMFWTELQQQRKEIIQQRPALAYQLKDKSIFPLMYDPDIGPGNLTSLLKQYNVELIPGHLYHGEALRKKVTELANRMITYEAKSFSETVRAIAEHSHCTTSDLEFSNYFTFTTAVLKSVECPTFKDAWLRTHFHDENLRTILFDLEDVEEEMELSKALATEDGINKLYSFSDFFKEIEPVQDANLGNNTLTMENTYETPMFPEVGFHTSIDSGDANNTQYSTDLPLYNQGENQTTHQKKKWMMLHDPHPTAMAEVGSLQWINATPTERNAALNTPEPSPPDTTGTWTWY